MNDAQSNLGSVGIPEQIIEEFIRELAIQKLPDDVVAQLSDTLLKKKDISEIAIKAALFSSDQAA
jgi:hypothetical protein